MQPFNTAQTKSEAALESEPDDRDLRAHLERAAHHSGVKRTAVALGISRESLLGVIAGMPVRPGTLALIRERVHLVEKLVGARGPGDAP